MSDLRQASHPVSAHEAFADNRLLSTFPAELREELESRARLVELDPGATVLRRGAHVDTSLFPFGSTMISLVVDLADGRSVEVASIGREGAVGGIVSCGYAPAFTRAEVIVVGNGAAEFSEAVTRCRPDQIVIDLVRLPVDLSRVSARYDGICW